MTAELGSVPSPAGLTPVSTWNRIYGFGSVYAKTAPRLAPGVHHRRRPARPASCSRSAPAIPNVFSSPAARDEIVRLANELGGAAQGIAGNPVNVGTLGGYIQWKYGPVFAWIVGLWSILALSSTLAERGAARQPRVRRGRAVRQAPDRAREARRPPDGPDRRRS